MHFKRKQTENRRSAFKSHKLRRRCYDVHRKHINPLLDNSDISHEILTVHKS